MRFSLTWLVLLSSLNLSLATRIALADDASAVEQRLLETIKYLASDELEGRGPGTRGIDLAADYIAGRFASLGLRTDLADGKPFQSFSITIKTALGPINQLALVGPPAADSDQARRLELKLAEQFTPFAAGGSSRFDLPITFVGYGITANKEGYDDYEGLDVKGRAVIVLRHEPQQSNPHSAFNGEKDSEYGSFSRKISNAYEHGAAAIIFCTDQFDIDKQVAQWESRWQTALDQLAEENQKFKTINQPNAEQRAQHREQAAKLISEVQQAAEQLKQAADPMLGFERAGAEGSGRSFPVLYCRRAPIDEMLQASLGVGLAQLEKEIDRSPSPQSRVISGWRAAGEVTIERQDASVKNVIGVLEGEGPLADETIVIGAHYDHLGFGGAGSLMPSSNDIHNGADDNASGTTSLLEVARQLVEKRLSPRRRLAFIAFTGEERGLLGSAHYIHHPLIPLEKTVAMLNLDMVGRLTEEKLIVYGAGTAPEFDPLIDRLAQQGGFQLTKHPEGMGPSDHQSFYLAKVPALHFFTGTHSDYHRPSDDYDKINIPGMRRITELVVTAATELTQAAERPKFQETSGKPTAGSGGDRPYFGSIPDFSQNQTGYALSGVTKDGPAAKAGLQAGDVIIGLGASQVGNLEDFDSALRKFKAGDKVPVKLKRQGAELSVEVTLDPPR